MRTQNNFIVIKRPKFKSRYSKRSYTRLKTQKSFRKIYMVFYENLYTNSKSTLGTSGFWSIIICLAMRVKFHLILTKLRNNIYKFTSKYFGVIGAGERVCTRGTNVKGLH